MTTKTVWVVEQGEYSDYHVVGVFSSEADARYIADALNAPRDGSYGGYTATVAEWPLDPGVQELRQGYVPYHVLMLEDGTVERVARDSLNGYDLAGSVRMWRRTNAPAYRGKGIPDVLQATVWAKDETHAVKIVNEHRIRMLASGEWAGDAKP